MASSARSPRPGRQQFPQFGEETIKARAFEIYLREGSIAGHDERHWQQAIEELTEETSQPRDMYARPE